VGSRPRALDESTLGGENENLNPIPELWLARTRTRWAFMVDSPHAKRSENSPFLSRLLHRPPAGYKWPGLCRRLRRRHEFDVELPDRRPTVRQEQGVSGALAEMMRIRSYGRRSTLARVSSARPYKSLSSACKW
jgi:hypothetical protein